MAWESRRLFAELLTGTGSTDMKVPARASKWQHDEERVALDNSNFELLMLNCNSVVLEAIYRPVLLTLNHGDGRQLRQG
ncbi:hypothetical protein BFW01_g1812 [Lasiodiplodia theobromae]|uniref:Uncharacterized protein n=1 Tax=Lasiodiplodia theobromae TaxID=45133 RepID=A0A8H7ITB4_9PEZI|nr:hypothetical protein BFW01_g1812 [Lasiodiplodia theobromae]